MNAGLPRSSREAAGDGGGWVPEPGAGRAAAGRSTVVELVAQHASARPDAVAVRDRHLSLTYRELHERAGAVARRLRGVGAGRGTVVALDATPSARTVVAVLGVLRAGAAHLALDTALPPRRRAAQVRDARPHVRLTEPGTARLPGVDIEHLPIIGALPEGWVGDTPGDQELPGLCDPAYVVYTSGTTGRPKGVLVHHEGLAIAAVEGARRFGLGPGVRMLQAASWSFDAAVWETFMALTAGAELVVSALDEVDLHVTADTVDAAMLTPTVAAWLPHDRPATLRTLGFGGERCSAALLHRFAHVPRLLNCYGPAETSICVTIHDCDPHGGHEPGGVQPHGGDGAADHTAGGDPPVGAPLPGGDVYVLDDHDRLVPGGEVGELVIAGAVVGLGYLGQPALTAERFVPDPFTTVPGARMYRTGDLARRDAGGLVHVLGRRDGQVKVRGVRIELGEVEAVARSVPAVADAGACVLHGDRDPVIGLGLTLAAAGHDAAATVRQVGAHCRVNLHPAMHPAHVVVMDRLPVLPSGKLDRQALAATLAGHQGGTATRGAQVHHDPQGHRAVWRDTVEQAVAEAFAETCPHPPRAATDELTSLGGHSLTAARVAVRLREWLGVSIGFADLLAAGSVAAVADLVRGATTAAGHQGPAPGADGQPPLLSFGEERLWFLWRLDPSSLAYLEPVRVRFAGDMDEERLRRAVDRVLARHEVLRTRYVTGPEGSPRRVVDDQPPRIRLVDLSDRADARTAADAWVTRAEARAFDLEHEPPVRAALLRLGPREHLVALQLHHIACDGWSNTLLVEQILAAYNGTEPGDGTTGETSYATYASLQRRAHTPERQERLAGFWRAELDGAPLLLDLPLAADRRDGASPAARAHELEVPAPVVAALERRARDEGATLFHLLLTALAVQLSRLAAVDDVVVACLAGHRPDPALARVVGFFVETVPVRTRLAGQGTAGELLRQVRAASVRALQHAELPFDEIVQAVDAPRRAGTNPVAQVALNLLDLPQVSGTIPGVEIETAFGTGADSKFDLTLYAQRSRAGAGSGLRLRWLYRDDLFRGDDIMELAAQYVALLDQLAGDDRLLDELVLDSPGRRRRQAAHRRRPRPVDVPSVPERFRACAAATPDATAIDGGQRLSYRAVDQRVTEFTAALSGAGLGSGSPVAVLARRSPALAVAVLGLLERGVPFCIVDAALPPAMVQRYLEHLGPAATVQAIAGAAPRLVTGSVGDPSPATAVPSDVAVLTYTSGTSGRPKLVLAGRGALDRHVDWEAALLRAGPGDRLGLLSGLMYDPVMRDLLLPLATGATLVVPPDDLGADGLRIERWLRAERVTVWHTTPGLLRLAAEWSTTPNEHMRAILSGGEALPVADIARTARAFPRARLVNVYGTTETPQVVSFHEPGRAPVLRNVVPLGSGTPTSRLAVVDHRGRLAATGARGEIAVQSPYVALGYRDDPGHAAFRDGLAEVAGRVYLTGDLGAHDADGTVHYLGRADDQMKIGGVRVEPAEIETVLRRHEAVAQAAVRLVGEGDARVLTAFVVLRPPHDAGVVDELHDHLSGKLPSVLVPTVRVVEALRYRPNGKLDPVATAATERRASAGEPPPGAPASATAMTIRDLMSGLLGRVVPSVDDDFFRLGGHSLLAARLLAGIHKHFGVEIPLRDLFPVATARRLAALVDARLASGDDAEVAQLAGLLSGLDATELAVLIDQLGGDTTEAHRDRSC